MKKFIVPLPDPSQVLIGDILVEGDSAGRVIERNVKKGYVLVAPVRVVKIERNPNGSADKRRSRPVAKRNS